MLLSYLLKLLPFWLLFLDFASYLSEWVGIGIVFGVMLLVFKLKQYAKQHFSMKRIERNSFFYEKIKKYVSSQRIYI